MLKVEEGVCGEIPYGRGWDLRSEIWDLRPEI
jgi:hypothetical protein